MKHHHIEIPKLDCSNDCSAAKKLLNAFIDTELEEQDAASVTGHLETCAECAEYYNQLKFIVDTAITLDEIPMPDDVSKRLNDFLRENMKRKF